MSVDLDFNDVLNILEGDEFDERPVDFIEFVNSEDYLNKPTTKLSEYQLQLVEVSTQIFKRSTLHNLHGFEEGERRWAKTKKEIIFQLGKGSGKDFTSTLAMAYIVYLLLCLKDPAAYYGNDSGTSVDLINVAINAEQASNVFFKEFKRAILGSPWFRGKFTETKNVINFDKNVNCYSAHSEREGWEGYNVFYCVLDEIAGFALESTSGNEASKTAKAIYDMYSDSVTSRFPEFGKVVLLSYSRYKGDFIQQRYDAVIAAKETVIRSHTFKMDPDLPDGTEGNEFTIEWEEDHIIGYHTPEVFALRRPSWEVNPTKNIEMYKLRFATDPIISLQKYACMPPDAIDAFFKDKEKVRRAFSKRPKMDLDGTFHEDFQPDPTKRYFVHVDLARVHDHAAVAMAHVEKWEKVKIGSEKYSEPAPLVIVDCIRFWTPTKTKNVDFTDIRQFILSLKQRGFDVKLTTFDRWESADTMQYLSDRGMKTERLSVAKKHYEDFAMVVAEERVQGPEVQLLIDEMSALMIMKNDKVDHPRKGSKDLADAVCGAIYNAIAHTPRQTNEEIEVKSLARVYEELNAEEEDTRKRVQESNAVIRAPRKPMPKDLEEYLMRLQLI